MKSFSEEDVLTVARAVIEKSVIKNVEPDDDDIFWFTCNYCSAVLRRWEGDKEDFKHELDCPVLVAQDLLTGYKKGEDNE